MTLDEVIAFDLLIKAPVGLLPAVAFLAVLLYMDSFKLVKLRFVVSIIFAGASRNRSSGRQIRTSRGDSHLTQAATTNSRSNIEMKWAAQISKYFSPGFRIA